VDTPSIIRAWKDPEYRARLSTEQRASLPESPSGSPLTELGEEELRDITGGRPILEGSTGCTGPVRETCGIVLCPIITDR
jgi:mersacidin/lichenicidin family type 2 lantibiotic